MTIRYKCADCGAVLKVKDELAGTDGKCPKCKTHFTVPTPEDESPGIELDESPADDDAPPEAADDDLIDLPMDVTPDVDLPTEVTPTSRGDDDFDPMDVLGDGHAPPGRTTATEHRPSVAELMRDYEKTRKKPAPAKEKPSRGNLAAASAVAGGVVTSGSAADVLSRTYEKKRGKANSPAPLSRDQQRAVEQTQAMKKFALQAGLAVAGVGVLSYFLVSWMMSETLPPLADVSGVVTLKGQPMDGVRVQFAPLRDPAGGQPEAGPSMARTNNEGQFVLMYDPVNEGAAIGWHQVELSTREGMLINVPESSREVEVTADGDNVFEFKL